VPSEALQGTLNSVRAAARLFRLGMNGQASDTLVRAIDGVTELLIEAGEDATQRVAPILADLLLAQEQGDVVRLADLLEFELGPALAPCPEPRSEEAR
jgi:hypothetical protein